MHTPQTRYRRLAPGTQPVALDLPAGPALPAVKTPSTGLKSPLMKQGQKPAPGSKEGVARPFQAIPAEVLDAVCEFLSDEDRQACVDLSEASEAMEEAFAEFPEIHVDQLVRRAERAGGLSDVRSLLGQDADRWKTIASIEQDRQMQPLMTLGKRIRSFRPGQERDAALQAFDTAAATILPRLPAAEGREPAAQPRAATPKEVLGWLNRLFLSLALADVRRGRAGGFVPRHGISRAEDTALLELEQCRWNAIEAKLCQGRPLRNVADEFGIKSKEEWAALQARADLLRGQG